ncbi:hypothetical protein [Brachybacterium hainanense]|uniref:Minor tail protein n=1 Tax=Brachybacterium hainanense TaxID=1541174 RepID=A0ABV6RB07_9MICO
MGLTPTWYVADFMTGDLIDTFPLEGVQLESSLRPGMFSASLDLRKTGRSMGEARELLDLLKNGKGTLVPVLEGLSNGAGNPPISRELGEWWIGQVAGTYRSPIVQISGPEFSGYAREVLLAEDFKGTLDPVKTAREMLALLYSRSQTVAVDLQGWVSHTGARVEVDARKIRDTYWDHISDLQEAEGGPFEWMIRSGLVTTGWVPQRVTRTLEIGQPTLAFSRPDITLEVTGPGSQPASLLDAGWGWDERASASTVYGWGAGAGADQVGEAFASRSREPGEPVKNRLVTDPAAMTMDRLRRTTRAALRRFSPEERTFTATMPTDRYTPRTGEVYQWRSDPTWTRPGETGTVRCVGWSWSSSHPDDYTLDLVR